MLPLGFFFRADSCQEETGLAARYGRRLTVRFFILLFHFQL
jgi:hypothetical protein